MLPHHHAHSALAVAVEVRSETRGCLISRTRTLAFLPPAVVKGWPATSHSPVSSAMRSPIWKWAGKMRMVPDGSDGGMPGSCGWAGLALAFLPGRDLAVQRHAPSLAHSRRRTLRVTLRPP